MNKLNCDLLQQQCSYRITYKAMANTLKKNILLSIIIVTLLSFDVPNGWSKAGSNPQSYETGLAKNVGKDGKSAAYIKSIEKDISGFGTLMQQIKPDKYLGKRIKMTGYVKTENVTNWSGLWMRVDQKGKSIPLSFDNMHDRPIKGNTDWEKYEIILDIPFNSSLIAYGALLHGTGQLWFDNITIEIVEKSIPTTGSINSKLNGTLDEPVNLDFEQ